MRRLLWGFLMLCLCAGAALADEPVEQPAPLLGVGYKLGNGIGFYGGDVVVDPLPHLSIDLYGSYVSEDAGYNNGAKATGFALAPAIQGYLFAGRRSTPYLAVGMQYVSLSLGSSSASGTGFFANIGYEWKFRFGLGIQLGAGIQHLSRVDASDGVSTVSLGGQTKPNIELGIRYMFL